MSYIRTLKRIRNNKTNYRKRKALLIGRRNFITIKTTNEHVHCQLIKPLLKGDKVLSFSNSKELAKYGWKGSSNNLSASFLVGLLLGKKMLSKNNNSAVLYTGKTPFTSKVAACLKGIAFSGVKIPLSEDSLPVDDRINASHVAGYASTLKSDKDLYNKRFSKLLRNNLNPEDYPKHFEEIKNKILSSDFS
jgi:large subunit ribosomal protein L18